MNGIHWNKIDTNINPDKVVIIGSGPSLYNFDVNKLKDKGYFIIVVNDAYKLVNFADMWFTLDPWGINRGQLPDATFKGELWCAVPEDFALPNARINDHKIEIPTNRSINFLHRIVFHTDINSITKENYLTWGLNEDPSCINTLNSGFGAFGIAYHLRPRKILLLGLDASTGYFFDKDKKTRSLNHLPLIFESTIPQIKKHNIQIVNGSEFSNITCFPRYNVDKALEIFDE